MKIITFGCRMNTFESAVMARLGVDLSDNVILVNTCAVTQEAERKSRQFISRIKRLNENAEIIITGCASQKNKEFYESKGVKYISGVGNKNKIIDDFTNGLREGDFLSPKLYEEPNATPKAQRTRVYVKIQDGCNNFCTYCIIPFLRGRSRSRLISNCVDEVKEISKRTNEIVITGVNLAQFGVDNGESLPELINALKDVDVRVRLGSFYVEGITDELLVALKGLKSFCPHFHLSLQHGDDGVLKSMNRHYGTTQYFEKVNLIRKYFPLAAITTDIIVGFPTESEEAFNNTINFVREVGFSDIHIFPFSAREGTKAYNMQRISPDIIKMRKIVR